MINPIIFQVDEEETRKLMGLSKSTLLITPTYLQQGVALGVEDYW
jgi:hypothetical protein